MYGLCNVAGDCPAEGTSYRLVSEGVPGNWRDEVGIKRAFVVCEAHAAILDGIGS